MADAAIVSHGVPLAQPAQMEDGIVSDNAELRFPSYWNSKRRRLEVLCENQELKWRGIVTRVDAVLAGREQIFVVIQATGSNPRKLSDCDIANAELSALVVSQQRWRDLRCKEIRALLKFPGNCRVEIDVDLKTTNRRLKKYFATSRQPRLELPLPTPVLGYLMTCNRL